jgi:hypothetical protein
MAPDKGIAVTKRLFLSLLVALFCSCVRSPAVRQIEITSSWTNSRWTTRSIKISLIIVRRSDGYWADDRKIPEAAVRDLVSAVMAHPVIRPDLNNLGMTRKWLDETASEALRNFENERKVQLTKRDQERFLATFGNRQVIRQALETAFIRHKDDFPAMDVNLVLESSERIRVSSRSQYSYMLPWVVTRNGSYVQTYNADIGRAIARIVPSRFLNSERLDNGKIRFDVIYFVTRYNEGIIGDPAR